MKPLEIVLLLATIVIATLVIFLLQPAILSAEWDLVDINRGELSDWREKLMWPSLYVNYALGVFATLFWIAKSNTFQAVSSRQTLSNTSFWWLLCVFYALISLGVVIALSFFYELINEKDFLQFLIYLSLFAIVDVVLMYWLPTAIATPGTMRYVPPGSRLLRSIYGG